MGHNAVIWFEIYVQEMPRAKAFYESVFQVRLEQLGGPDSEMWRFPEAEGEPGINGALVKMEGMASGGNGVINYFMCDDCANEAGRVADAGGRVVREKMDIGEYGFIVLVMDTEGNMIGLHSTS